jgi:hypothetical protein
MSGVAYANAGSSSGTENAPIGTGTVNDPIVLNGDDDKKEEAHCKPTVGRTPKGEFYIHICCKLVCISRPIPPGVDPQETLADLQKAVTLLNKTSLEGNLNIDDALSELADGKLPILFKTRGDTVRVAAITFMVVFAIPENALGVLKTCRLPTGYMPTLFDQLGKWGHRAALIHLFLDTPTNGMPLDVLKQVYLILTGSLAASVPHVYDTDAKHAPDNADNAAPPSLDDAIEADAVRTTVEFTCKKNGAPFAVIICRAGDKAVGKTFPARYSLYFDSFADSKGPVELPIEFESLEEAARFLSLLECLVTGIMPDLKVGEPVTAKALHKLIVRNFTDIQKTVHFTNFVAKALQIYWSRNDQAPPILWDIMQFLYDRCNLRAVAATPISLANLTKAFITSGIDPQEVLAFVQKILLDQKVPTLPTRPPTPEDSTGACEETKENSPAPLQPSHPQKMSKKRKKTEQSDQPMSQQSASMLADTLKIVIKWLCLYVIEKDVV